MTERPTFLSAIVDLQLSTRAELEEALVRQLIYGGDLPTSILELRLVDEAGIARALERSTGLPYRSGPHPIDRALSETVLSHFPQTFVSPREDGLWVITSEASRLLDKEQELAMLLGQPVGLAIEVPFRVEEVLGALGHAPSPRARALVTRLGERPPRFVEAAPPPASLPPVSALEALPEARPALASLRDGESSPLPARVDVSGGDEHTAEAVATQPPPGDYARLAADSAESIAPPTIALPPTPAPTASVIASSPVASGSVASSPDAPLELLPSSSVEHPPAAPAAPAASLAPSTSATPPTPKLAADREPPSKPAPPEPPKPDSSEPRTPVAARKARAATPPRRDALDRRIAALEAAQKALGSARDRNSIFEIVLRALSNVFEYAALFAVSSNEARGLSATGPGNSSIELPELKIPLDLNSPFRRAVQDGVHQLTRLRASGLEGGVAHDLGRPTGRRVLLLPVVLRGRTVVLLYGDQGAADVDAGSIGEVIALAPAIAHAFERVLMERKRNSVVPQNAASLGKLVGIPAAPRAPSIIPDVHAPRGDEPPAHLSLPSEYRPRPGEEGIPSLRAALAGRATQPGVAPSTATVVPSVAEAPPVEPLEAPAPHVDAIAPIPAPVPSRNLSDDEARPASTKRDAAAPPAQPSTPPLAPSATLSTSASTSTNTNTSASAATATRGAKPAGPEPRTESGLARVSEPPPPDKPSIAKRPSPRPVSHFAREFPERKSRPPAPPAEGSESARPEGAPSSHQVAVNAQRTLDDPSFPNEAPRTWKGFPGTPSPPSVHEAETTDVAPAPVLAPSTSPAPAMTPRRMVSLDARIAPSAAQPTLTEAPEPRLPSLEIRGTGTLVSRRPLLDEPPEDGWGGPTNVPRVSRRPVGPRSYDELVSRLLAGDTEALDKLLEGGESAVASLIARFPGPLREPASPQEKASECGPLLGALVRFGPRATPFLTVRTADENAEVRRWATALLGELPSRDAAKAIAGRLLDGAPQVRVAALSGARRLQSELLARRALRAQLEELALDVRLGTESRSAIVQAIADVREHEAVPVLLQLLGDRDRSVARAAQWALSVLTRQDFGSDFARWQAFWIEHRDEHRMDWLIAALTHEKPDLRRAAHEEIKTVAGQDFGYHEELPEAERFEIQALVHTWWTRNRNDR